MASGDPCLMQFVVDGGSGENVIDFLLVPEPQNDSAASLNNVDGSHDGAHGQTDGQHQLFDSGQDPSADNATLTLTPDIGQTAIFTQVSGNHFQLAVATNANGDFTVRGSWKDTPILVFVEEGGGE